MSNELPRMSDIDDLAVRVRMAWELNKNGIRDKFPRVEEVTYFNGHPDLDNFSEGKVLAAREDGRSVVKVIETDNPELPFIFLPEKPHDN